MDKATIGIRQADGSFYEIMGDSQSGHKRLVLSAARTDQHGVKIDLYRSTDGTVDPSGSLGTISLDDPEGLGYKDIEFRVDLGAEGRLDASAALPGQAPRTLSVDLTPFRGRRTDADILGDESFDTADLDTLDDSFAGGAMTLDLPEADDLGSLGDLDEPEGTSPRRTDADILGDESFASADLDSLDDFSFDDEGGTLEADALTDETVSDGLPAAGADDPFASAPDLDDTGLPSLDLSSLDGPDAEPAAGGEAGEDPFGMDLPDLSEEALPEVDLSGSEGPRAADSFDLGDLDAGFGDDSAEVLEEETPAPAVNPAEDWEKVSFDDMESMEFLDTGDEISKPSKASAAPAKPAPAEDSFHIDHDDPLDLGEYDSDLSDLPDLGDLGSAPSPEPEDDGLDQDFLAPPALTDEPLWAANPSDDEGPRPAKEAKGPKAGKVPKAEKPRPEPRDGEGGLDKTALVLSLATLSLLVLLILVLLFLNMIKAPQAPVIQPEVMRWNPAASVLTPGARASAPAEADLAAADPVVFEASTVLEVPASLKASRVALRLGPGDTAADAARRFGEPARTQGNLLLW